MQINDKAYILKRNLFGENNFVITLFSENHGLMSGAVKMALGSKKLQNFFPGNLIEFSWTARLENHLGTLKGDLLESIGFRIMNCSKRLSILHGALDLLSHSLPERLIEQNLFYGLRHLIQILKNGSIEEIYIEYINFELLYLKEFGFEMDFSKCALTGQTEDLYYISPITGKSACKQAAQAYKERLFLIHDLLQPDGANEKTFQKAASISGYFIEKFIFSNKNKKLPSTRINIHGIID